MHRHPWMLMGTDNYTNVQEKLTNMFKNSDY